MRGTVQTGNNDTISLLGAGAVRGQALVCGVKHKVTL